MTAVDGQYSARATRDLASGEVVGRLPTSLVISAREARGSPEGQLLAQYEAKHHGAAWTPLPSRWYLYLFLVAEAAKGPRSRWGPYFAAAPKVFDDPLWFTPGQRQLLVGTNLDAALKLDEAALETLAAACFPGIYDAGLDGAAALFPPSVFTLERIKWARSLYSSRCFPAALLKEAHPTAADLDEDCGCMLPLLDMLNHGYRRQITWQTSKAAILFQVNEAIPAHAEVFNNYGPKGNEELLRGYGFCIPDNPADVVAVRLAIDPARLSTRKRKLLDRFADATKRPWQDQLLHRDRLSPLLLGTLRLLELSESEAKSTRWRDWRPTAAADGSDVASLVPPQSIQLEVKVAATCARPSSSLIDARAQFIDAQYAVAALRMRDPALAAQSRSRERLPLIQTYWDSQRAVLSASQALAHARLVRDRGEEVHALARVSPSGSGAEGGLTGRARSEPDVGGHVQRDLTAAAAAAVRFEVQPDMVHAVPLEPDAPPGAPPGTASWRDSAAKAGHRWNRLSEAPLPPPPTPSVEPRPPLSHVLVLNEAVRAGETVLSVRWSSVLHAQLPWLQRLRLRLPLDDDQALMVVTLLNRANPALLPFYEAVGPWVEPWLASFGDDGSEAASIAADQLEHWEELAHALEPLPEDVPQELRASTAFSPQAVRQAAGIVMGWSHPLATTRNSPDRGEPVWAVLPWCPRLRHHPFAQFEWRLDRRHDNISGGGGGDDDDDDDDDRVRLVALTDQCAGTEVTVVYGGDVPPSDTSEAALRFGFQTAHLACTESQSR